MVINQRAVFGDKRYLVFDLRKERDELVILVAARHHKFNALLLQRRILRCKPFFIVLFVVVKKGAVHIYCDELNFHTASFSRYHISGSCYHCFIRLPYE